MSRFASSTIPHSRLRNLTTELRRRAPLLADRLSNASIDREVLDIVAKLVNLSVALIPFRDRKDVSKAIAQFISDNLHKGLTLKLLVQFMRYSEKYCSKVFRSVIGESLSRYLGRRRIDAAVALLRTTDNSLSEIAFPPEFSDQFVFSHFFKRSTGRSPRDVRTDRAQRRPRRVGFQSFQATR